MTARLIGIVTQAAEGIAGHIILPAAGAIVVIMLIWGGIQYIQGNAEGGKKTILAAVIGLVIIMLSAVILTLATQALHGTLVA